MHRRPLPRLSSPWLPTPPTRPCASALSAKLKVDGEYPAGRFAVRAREQANQWVLSVNFRGKPTHHLCNKDDDGAVCVNKKS